MGTNLQVSITFPKLREDIVAALDDHLGQYADADEVVVESDNFGVRIIATYSGGQIDSVSDNALTSAMCVIEAVDFDELPKKAVVTIKDLMP